MNESRKNAIELAATRQGRSLFMISHLCKKVQDNHDSQLAKTILALIAEDIKAEKVRDTLDDILKAFEDERGASALQDTFWLRGGVTVFEALCDIRQQLFGPIDEARTEDQCATS
jgi:hypothetical protein